MASTFFEKINARWAAGARFCVGLDPDMEKIEKMKRIPKKAPTIIHEVNYLTIDATKDTALCYKPNRAYYKGPAGLQAELDTMAYIRNVAGDVPVIDDGKYGDIGNTNAGYVKWSFDELKADAVTVHPTLGKEAMVPFLDRSDKTIFVLCKTSNKGSDEFQDRRVDYNDEEAERFGLPVGGTIYMYELIALRVRHYWNYNDNCGLVIGATYPCQLKQVRKLVGDMPILIPGAGAQKGDVLATVRAGRTSQGASMIISSSSAIMFDPDPKVAAQRQTDEINAALA